MYNISINNILFPSSDVISVLIIITQSKIWLTLQYTQIKPVLVHGVLYSTNAFPFVLHTSINTNIYM